MSVEDTEQINNELEDTSCVMEDQFSGEYPEIYKRYKSGESLLDSDLDTIADLAISIIRELLGFFGASDSPIDEFEGEDGELILDVNAPDLAVLIGHHGHTLESFQTIVSLILSRKLGFRYPISVDIEGYKSRRRDKVASMAQNAAQRALEQGRSVSLPPMSAYERRLVHIALRDIDQIVTHSEGVDPGRRVVISPRQS